MLVRANLSDEIAQLVTILPGEMVKIWEMVEPDMENSSAFIQSRTAITQPSLVAISLTISPHSISSKRVPDASLSSSLSPKQNTCSP